MTPHPLNNFEIIKYYENQSRFNGVYSRDNLPNKIGTDSIALYVKNNDITYFDSFGVEHIPKEFIKFINRPLSSASQNKILRQIFLGYRHMIQ